MAPCISLVLVRSHVLIWVAIFVYLHFRSHSLLLPVLFWLPVSRLQYVQFCSPCLISLWLVSAVFPPVVCSLSILCVFILSQSSLALCHVLLLGCVYLAVRSMLSMFPRLCLSHEFLFSAWSDLFCIMYFIVFCSAIKLFWVLHCSFEVLHLGPNLPSTQPTWHIASKLRSF